ncbi:MFS transporter [Marimonas sp. MJW-29]|uniref:MFS transporter n=1 Tax=Sulfitobacter sediminis TaxID=3234186 RepID=A0ABV3RGU4_9RHOB
MARNLALYPWFKFAQSLLFWQAVWFLYFQQTISPAAAIAMYAVYDISVTVLEVPLGVLSDRIGRRKTLILSGLAGTLGSVLLALGDSLAVFALGQFCIGAGAAFASGTDSAMLFESLAGEGREDDVEAEETRALQYSLWGFAVSAAIGGAMALWSFPSTFWAAAAAMVISALIALRMVEPPRHMETGTPAAFWAALRAALARPVLRWIFLLAVVMYGFSHLPFVFGQPFIAAALQDVGLSGEAPLVSGSVSAVMMGLSVVASLFALRLRGKIGLTAMLLLAFGMQIALIAVLAVTDSWLAIAVLFLRIVPDALSRPFQMGRIQPLLRDEVRATYVSMQSLAGKLAFSVSLLFAAGSASDVAEMPHGDIQMILGWYVGAGALIWAGLALTAKRAGVEPVRKG